MDYIKELHELCDVLDDELIDVNEKLRGGKMSAGDLDYVDKLTHAIKSVKTTIAMEEAGDDYSGRWMPVYGRDYDGRSYRGRKRDSMGRYSSRYSRADGMDAILDEMRGMMNDLPEDKRREVERFIDRMEK